MRARRRRTSEINVVPYIDVMLVLLIIFMVTAPLLTTGVKVDLPDAQAQPMEPSEDQQPIVLTVTAAGDMYLGDQTEQPLSPQTVVSTAAKIIRQRPDVPVVVKGDGSSSYANVVQAMVLLQKAGADQVGLLTDNIAPTDGGNNTAETD